MGFLELFLIGVGLSMDAFAVAICQGLSMTKIKWGHALTVGLYFGGFQALMPFWDGYLVRNFQDISSSMTTGSPLFCCCLSAAT